eukprot:6201888-Pleurochrysis_carterae.AAC.1
MTFLQHLRLDAGGGTGSNATIVFAAQEGANCVAVVAQSFDYRQMQQRNELYRAPLPRQECCDAV